VLYVQKGAVLIDHDHRPATYVAASVLALGLIFIGGASVRAEPAVVAHLSAPAAMSISLVQDGTETAYPTRAQTVAAFFAEHNITIDPDDYLSVPLDAALFEGMSIEYRPAVPVVLFVGNERRDVRSSALTVEQLLTIQGVELGALDEISPALDQRVLPHQLVRVVRVKTWIAKVRHTIAQPVQHHSDPNLDRGAMLTLTDGSPGKREIAYRLVSRNGEKAQRTVVSSRILRKPLPRVVAIGTADPQSLTEFAVSRLGDAIHIAGTAVRMIATAYVANCYGCSGITSLGLHAQHGVVAVDPQVIPLGTKLYVPGYGKAIAGDTGGAIRGRRIDLGFNSLAQALNFGRREITVYVLR
jgi:uncharacterized protein YabE (DUF348 family)